MGTLVGCAIVGIVCLVVGTVWGKNIEQKAVKQVLADFEKVDTAARSAVSRLESTLPYIKNRLHL